MNAANTIRISPRNKYGKSIGTNASNKETGIPSAKAFRHGAIHSANGKAKNVPPDIASRSMKGISLNLHDVGV